MKRYLYPSLVAAVFLLAFILRFYQLGDVPDGLYRDETSIGYNAYVILQTGKDEHGATLPTYFKSFGDYKLPAYIYLTAASIKVFGLNAFAVRFPSALFGFLSVIVLFFLLKEFTKDRWIPLTASFLLAITPLHLHFSRAGFEVNVALFFALLGTWTFLLGIRTKYMLYFYLSVLGFVLSLYSYNVTRLLSPLLFLALVAFHFKIIKRLPRKHIVGAVVFGTLLLLPFLISFFTRSGVASAKGALITSTDIQAQSLEMRSYLIDYPAFLTKVFFNKWIQLAYTYLQNLVSSLSPIFYFVSGSSHGNQGIGNVGVFYLFQFPLFLSGLIAVLKQKLRPYYFFLFWLILVILVVSLSKEVPHATRGYFITIPVTIFSAIGLVLLWGQIMKKFSFRIRTILLIMLLGTVLFHVVFYLASYYERFPKIYAKDWNQQDKALSLYLQEQEDNYDKIIIDTESGFSYSSLLFYTAYDPQSFLQEAERYPDDTEGFSKVRSFGKYEFKEIDWEKDYPSTNTLFVTLETIKPSEVTTYKMFYYPTRPVVVSHKEEIITFPYTEPAFVVIKSP